MLISAAAPHQIRSSKLKFCRGCGDNLPNGNGQTRLNFSRTTGLELMDDFLKAAEAVSAAGFGSNEVVRNALGIGYNRAKELIKRLQAEGILGCDLDEHARLRLLRPIGFY